MDKIRSWRQLRTRRSPTAFMSEIAGIHMKPRCPPHMEVLRCAWHKVECKEPQPAPKWVRFSSKAQICQDGLTEMAHQLTMSEWGSLPFIENFLDSRRKTPDKRKPRVESRKRRWPKKSILISTP